MKELVNDDAFEHGKLFDEKQFNTIILSRDGFDKTQNDVADLLESLLNDKPEREQRDAIIKKLKDSGSPQLMVKTIGGLESAEQKATLISACWESGLDFTPHFLFFVEIACGNDYLVAMEALTVVENCEGVLPDEVLAKALVMARESKNPNKGLSESLLQHIMAKIG